ncbi:MAG: fibrobacter succinogenes major paralogous domain-containing protein [candidate division Zixibacteria bacterium]|nr:fibrobacter succinogenes major paralogous domain-containing protein [candidate division Zixibacteria bacterium]
MFRKALQSIFPVFAVFTLVMIVGCGGDDTRANHDSPTVPIVATTEVSAIRQTTAQSGGNISSDGGAALTARGVCWSANSTPTIANSKTTDGPATGSYTSFITGLTAMTTYRVRAYATNSVGTGYGSDVTFTTGATSVADLDGNVYQAVTIGNQVWMAENLKVTHYMNGDPIPHVEICQDWAGLSTGAYASYNNCSDSLVNGSDSLVKECGFLYNWYAVNDNRKLGMPGWHVPSIDEWKQLEMYLGMSRAEAGRSGHGGLDEGGELKEMGTTHWAIPNTGATNKSGFSALPCGFRRSNDGYIFSMGNFAYFWCSTEYDSYYAWYRALSYDGSQVGHFYLKKRNGFSVRCVRD